MGEPDPRRWRALGACVCALYITLLDVSIVNVALVPIGRDTGAGPAQLQWVVSGYTLAFGMVPIIGGRLGDDYGRRRMFLVGVTGFVATSALVGAAPVPGLLIAGRVVQGLFGGLINPQVSGLVQQLFRGAHGCRRGNRGRAGGRRWADRRRRTATGLAARVLRQHTHRAGHDRARPALAAGTGTVVPPAAARPARRRTARSRHVRGPVRGRPV